MYSVIKTAVVCGFESLPVQVETDVSDGMPSFDMVGFLTSEVKRSQRAGAHGTEKCRISFAGKKDHHQSDTGRCEKIRHGM